MNFVQSIAKDDEGHSLERLRSEIAAAFQKEGTLSDEELVEVVRRIETGKPKIFYHATRNEEFEKIDPNYFEREEIVLAGGHFSYKADNLSYGSYDPAKLIEFRVIDTAGELKDTSETGEGTAVGYEAIALRPIVLKKLDDREYTAQEISNQSGLKENFYGDLSEKKIRQITYIIDKESTGGADIKELMKDPAFALKYLKDQVKESLDDPIRWMNERSAQEYTRLFDLNEADVKNPEVERLLWETKLKFSEWFQKALAKEEQVVEVLARERISWQDKTDSVIKKIISNENLKKFYLEEYLAYVLGEGGLYEVKKEDLEELRSREIEKILRFLENKR